jgi:hypothetical protein
MLVAILFDSRTAFYVTITMSLLLAGIRGNDYDSGIAMIMAGTLAAYTVRDIQSRTQMFQSLFFIFIGFIISIVSIGFERSNDINSIIQKCVLASMNSIISPIITFGLLFIFDKSSRLTSDLQLEEYDKLNHPLLIRLNEKAPGTYQHTITLAMLAENCARATNGNPLLAKVGAYFHDIGKMIQPEYFGENQIDIENKHESLTPQKSVETIKSHVQEGIKLAHEYKLPKRIIDFIPMHHGTSLIKHFYALAIESAAYGKEINQNQYRYPGPKPNNKETAIVMICDSAEALSKVPNIDKEKFEQNIQNLINDKISDGQFDNCDITLKDLFIIKETCLKNLLGISHPRAVYKEIPAKDN